MGKMKGKEGDGDGEEEEGKGAKGGREEQERLRGVRIALSAPRVMVAIRTK